LSRCMRFAAGLKNTWLNFMRIERGQRL